MTTPVDGRHRQLTFVLSATSDHPGPTAAAAGMSSSKRKRPSTGKPVKKSNDEPIGNKSKQSTLPEDGKGEPSASLEDARDTVLPMLGLPELIGVHAAGQTAMVDAALQAALASLMKKIGPELGTTPLTKPLTSVMVVVTSRDFGPSMLSGPTAGLALALETACRMDADNTDDTDKTSFVLNVLKYLEKQTLMPTHYISGTAHHGITLLYADY